MIAQLKKEFTELQRELADVQSNLDKAMQDIASAKNERIALDLIKLDLYSSPIDDLLDKDRKLDLYSKAMNSAWDKRISAERECAELRKKIFQSLLKIRNQIDSGNLGPEPDSSDDY